MENSSLEERIEREKSSYDQQLVQRGRYDKFFLHVDQGPSGVRKRDMFRSLLLAGENKTVLELGTAKWSSLIDFENHPPAQLRCINISETEVKKGIMLAKERGVDIEFSVMDVHQLEYPDNSFDVVYGTGILHHLDFERGVREVYRVLKPGGLMVFTEPLRLNPVGMLVRMLTPRARTADERPLGIAELKVIDKYFETKYSYHHFFSVPAGLTSRFVFRNPENVVTVIAKSCDVALERFVPIAGPFFRHILMCGYKRAMATPTTD